MKHLKPAILNEIHDYGQELENSKLEIRKDNQYRRSRTNVKQALIKEELYVYDKDVNNNKMEETNHVDRVVKHSPNNNMKNNNEQHQMTDANIDQDWIKHTQNREVICSLKTDNEVTHPQVNRSGKTKTSSKEYDDFLQLDKIMTPIAMDKILKDLDDKWDDFLPFIEQCI